MDLISVTKNLHAKAAELTYGECMDVVKASAEKKK